MDVVKETDNIQRYKDLDKTKVYKTEVSGNAE